jgi:ribose 5-phosphate isomerase
LIADLHKIVRALRKKYPVEYIEIIEFNEKAIMGRLQKARGNLECTVIAA